MANPPPPSPAPALPQSGIAAVDRYIADGFESVRGMSSGFATAISAYLMGRQSAIGVGGNFLEIGAFEGRFFIGAALALLPGETAIGIDLFDWPDAGIRDRFLGHCARFGVAGRSRALTGDSTTISPDAVRRAADGRDFRFIHIDGEHSPEALARDLALAHALLAPHGIIALDDMLHPAYPFLVVTVNDYLVAHPEMRLFCILDRADIVAAPKFLLCRAEVAGLYEADLMARFVPFHFVIGADARGHHAVVLTPEPKLADV